MSNGANLPASSPSIPSTIVGEDFPPSGISGTIHAQWGQTLAPPKLNDGHIDKLIANDEADSKRDFCVTLAQIGAAVLVLVIVLGFVLLVLSMLASTKPELAEKIIIGVFAFAGGLLAGAGGYAGFQKLRDGV